MNVIFYILYNFQETVTLYYQHYHIPTPLIDLIIRVHIMCNTLILLTILYIVSTKLIPPVDKVLERKFLSTKWQKRKIDYIIQLVVGINIHAKKLPLFRVIQREPLRGSQYRQYMIFYPRTPLNTFEVCVSIALHCVTIQTMHKGSLGRTHKIDPWFSLVFLCAILQCSLI